LDPVSGRLVLLGGAVRCGKSTRALELAEAWAGDASAPVERIFIATAQIWDDEMAERRTRHQAERGPEWTTWEEHVGVADRLHALDQRLELEGGRAVVVIDCLTLWLTAVLLEGGDHRDAEAVRPAADVEAAIDALAAVLRGPRRDTAVVSNEVGLGRVPSRGRSATTAGACTNGSQRRPTRSGSVRWGCWCG
jgi:adenosylcobinamide kinase / adenosylcobinamide-phosphate guanylyltransferase